MTRLPRPLLLVAVGPKAREFVDALIPCVTGPDQVHEARFLLVGSTASASTHRIWVHEGDFGVAEFLRYRDQARRELWREASPLEPTLGFVVDATSKFPMPWREIFRAHARANDAWWLNSSFTALLGPRIDFSSRREGTPGAGPEDGPVPRAATLPSAPDGVEFDDSGDPSTSVDVSTILEVACGIHGARSDRWQPMLLPFDACNDSGQVVGQGPALAFKIVTALLSYLDIVEEDLESLVPVDNVPGFCRTIGVARGGLPVPDVVSHLAARLRELRYRMIVDGETRTTRHPEPHRWLETSPLVDLGARFEGFLTDARTGFSPAGKREFDLDDGVGFRRMTAQIVDAVRRQRTRVEGLAELRSEIRRDTLQSLTDEAERWLDEGVGVGSIETTLCVIQGREQALPLSVVRNLDGILALKRDLLQQMGRLGPPTAAPNGDYTESIEVPLAQAEASISGQGVIGRRTGTAPGNSFQTRMRGLPLSQSLDANAIRAAGAVVFPETGGEVRAARPMKSIVVLPDGTEAEAPDLDRFRAFERRYAGLVTESDRLRRHIAELEFPAPATPNSSSASRDFVLDTQRQKLQETEATLTELTPERNRWIAGIREWESRLESEVLADQAVTLLERKLEAESLLATAYVVSAEGLIATMRAETREYRALFSTRKRRTLILSALTIAAALAVGLTLVANLVPERPAVLESGPAAFAVPAGHGPRVLVRPEATELELEVGGVPWRGHLPVGSWSLSEIARLFDAGSQTVAPQIVVSGATFQIRNDRDRLSIESGATNVRVRLPAGRFTPNEIARILRGESVRGAALLVDPDEGTVPRLDRPLIVDSVDGILVVRSDDTGVSLAHVPGDRDAYEALGLLRPANPRMPSLRDRAGTVVRAPAGLLVRHTVDRIVLSTEQHGRSASLRVFDSASSVAKSLGFTTSVAAGGTWTTSRELGFLTGVLVTLALALAGALLYQRVVMAGRLDVLEKSLDDATKQVARFREGFRGRLRALADWLKRLDIAYQSLRTISDCHAGLGRVIQGLRTFARAASAERQLAAAAAAIPKFPRDGQFYSILEWEQFCSRYVTPSEGIWASRATEFRHRWPPSRIWRRFEACAHFKEFDDAVRESSAWLFSEVAMVDLDAVLRDTGRPVPESIFDPRRVLAHSQPLAESVGSDAGSGLAYFLSTRDESETSGRSSRPLLADLVEPTLSGSRLRIVRGTDPFNFALSSCRLATAVNKIRWIRDAFTKTLSSPARDDLGMDVDILLAPWDVVDFERYRRILADLRVFVVTDRIVASGGEVTFDNGGSLGRSCCLVFLRLSDEVPDSSAVTTFNRLSIHDPGTCFRKWKEFVEQWPAFSHHDRRSPPAQHVAWYWEDDLEFRRWWDDISGRSFRDFADELLAKRYLTSPLGNPGCMLRFAGQRVKVPALTIRHCRDWMHALVDDPKYPNNDSLRAAIRRHDARNLRLLDDGDPPWRVSPAHSE